MDWLDRLGIAEFSERDVNSLSGGRRQRVALARALVTEPKILLLDEPLSALDAHLVIRMQGVLTKLQRELGITFVYVTHSQSEAFAMADRVVIMAKGEIAQIGSARDIYRTPANRFVAEFVGCNNILSGVAGPAIWWRRRLARSASVKTWCRVRPSPSSSRRIASPSRKCSLRVAGGIELKVQVQERVLGELSRDLGQTLYLAFDPTHAHVLKG